MLGPEKRLGFIAALFSLPEYFRSNCPETNSTPFSLEAYRMAPDFLSDEIVFTPQPHRMQDVKDFTKSVIPRRFDRTDLVIAAAAFLVGGFVVHRLEKRYA